MNIFKNFVKIIVSCVFLMSCIITFEEKEDNIKQDNVECLPNNTVTGEIHLKEPKNEI